MQVKVLQSKGMHVKNIRNGRIRVNLGKKLTLVNILEEEIKSESLSKLKFCLWVILLVKRVPAKNVESQILEFIKIYWELTGIKIYFEVLKFI